MSWINDFNSSSSIDNIRDYTQVNSNYTTTLNDYIVNCISNVEVTLITAVGNEGLEQVIKNSSSGNVKVKTTSSQTIDNRPFWIILTNNAIRVQSNGSNWIII
jgi:hypothetical protein